MGRNGPTYIATVEPSDAADRNMCTAPRDAAEANARLIGAAPDLLAIVEALYGVATNRDLTDADRGANLRMLIEVMGPALDKAGAA